MRLRAVTILVLLAALLAVPAATGAKSGQRAKPAPRVKLLECRTAVTQADRGAAFRGRMRAVAGAERMQMRFSLQARSPDLPRWHAQAAPGLGIWRSSDPRVTAYEFVQRVDNLIAPGSYRVFVRFRWLDAGGAVVARASRISAPCAQPDLRPNLVAVSFGATTGSAPGTIRYRVVVRNRGKSAAGAFDAVLTVNGGTHTVTVAGLAAAERRLVEVEAPRCQPGSVLVLQLDSRGQVDERNELDNQTSRGCPSGGVFGV